MVLQHLDLCGFDELAEVSYPEFNYLRNVHGVFVGLPIKNSKDGNDDFDGLPDLLERRSRLQMRVDSAP